MTPEISGEPTKAVPAMPPPAAPRARRKPTVAAIASSPLETSSSTAGAAATTVAAPASDQSPTPVSAPAGRPSKARAAAASSSPTARAARAARAARPQEAASVAAVPASTLCIDVGGSGVKGATCGPDGTLVGEPVRLTTTYPFPPARLIELISEIAAKSAPATRMSVGFPGMVRSGVVFSAPHFITKKGPGTATDPDLVTAWDHLALADALEAKTGLPTRLGNDADVQGLAAIEGKGLELVITLGTGIGTALFFQGALAPHLEFSHHPLFRGKTYNEVVGEDARHKVGDKKWSKRVQATVEVLAELTFYDKLYIGGGNATRLTSAFTHPATIVPNSDGITGGAKLWTLSTELV